MRFITRIHLSDCGWHEAYYPGTTIEFADPRTGKPSHTVFSLENTGGKTSFLALVLSCFDTGERRFLKTQIRPNQKFGDYFGSLPAFILVEWDLSGAQASFLEPERLVTGQVVVPRGEGVRRDLDRHFFTFRSAPGLRFDDIPAPGLGGFDEHGRLNGHQDVQQWLHAMRSDHPGNFQDFVRQLDWKRKLAEEKIDTELLSAQVDFNRSEGGIEDFLNFRSEPQFVRKFLAMTVPQTGADAVRGVLAEHVVRLADLPRLERRREAMCRLKEKFSPFVDVAAELRAAQDEVGRLGIHGASVKTALGAREKEASRYSQRLNEMAGAHETVAREAEAARKTARVELASAVVETARRRREHSEASASTRDKERQMAESRAHLLRAAVSMRDIVDDHSRIMTLKEAIDAEHADLQPRRDALGGIGACLAATLGHRATRLRERRHVLLASAEELAAAARETEVQRVEACEIAQTEHREAARIEVNLDHAHDIRAELEVELVLETGESAGAAVQRHAAEARTASEQADLLGAEANGRERDAARHREVRGDLKAERSGLEAEIESLSVAIREGESMRMELAIEPVVLELTGDSQVDPEADAVAAVLADARHKRSARLREDERRQAVLQADRESLEVAGLASIDMDVHAVVKRLRDSGIADAQPFASYLADILGSPDEVRRFAESDPARFIGVAVPNRTNLDTARDVLGSPPALSRPVTVAIADDTPSAAGADRFVLAVDEPAAYDRTAAGDLGRRMESDLADVALSIDALQARIDHLEATQRRIDAWRERFGGGRLGAMQQEANRKEARIVQIRSEIETLSERIGDAERDARDCRNRANERVGQSHACAERSRRADEYHTQWESKVDGWRRAHLDHRQRAASAIELAAMKEAERDAKAQETRQRLQEASQAAAEASEMEREVSEIAYSEPGGEMQGDLDVLRRDYKQNLEALQALERKAVDRLRGQLDEAERGLVEKEKRFARDFEDIARADAETEAVLDGLPEASEAANTTLEAARETASISRAEAVAVEKEYRSEKERCARDIRPDRLTDFGSLEPEELARITPRSEAIIVEEEAIAKRESDAARRCRDEAAQSGQTAKECRILATNLGSILGNEIVPGEPVDLPSRDDLDALVRGAVDALHRAREVLVNARAAVYASYDVIRRFTNSDTFRQLEGEREVALHLGANDALAAAGTAGRTAGLIDDRLKTIEHDIARLDDDLQACVGELERLWGTALHILRRMTRNGRIPDHVPRFGGQPVFRMSADFSRIPAVQRREILHSYVADLAETDRVPESGQDIAAELVDRMTGALGRSSLGIRLLKPKGEGDTEYMPIDKVTVSGGELLTAAMMIYMVLARLRAEAMQGRTSDGGVLFLDNPLGKANKTLLLKTQIGLADAMGIQLFYTTGIQDTNALAEFENIVRLRRSSQSRATGRIHVEVEAMRAYIDRPTADRTARPAAAAE